MFAMIMMKIAEVVQNVLEQWAVYMRLASLIYIKMFLT
jgi:hypothetical protein